MLFTPIDTSRRSVEYGGGGGKTVKMRPIWDQVVKLPTGDVVHLLVPSVVEVRRMLLDGTEVMDEVWDSPIASVETETESDSDSESESESELESESKSKSQDGSGDAEIAPAAAEPTLAT